MTDASRDQLRKTYLQRLDEADAWYSAELNRNTQPEQLRTAHVRKMAAAYCAYVSTLKTLRPRP
jgi:hypothetical protein